jgi:tRNA 5-methylaminomethyl-2-thiouridine biosynthesis bifunctional protein
MVTVPTAQLARAPDGTPFSAEFGDVYHASQGGLAQARHVFLAGNNLPERWQGRDSFVVIETGFGIGLNFLATWHAWRGDPRKSARLHFVSVESRPFSREDLAAALAPFEELAPLARQLDAAWPPPIAGFHRMQFDSGRVILTLLLGEAQELLPQLLARADALYLDGFSPARNPGLWSPEVVRELARIAAPGASLATWTVAGGVRSALRDAGFAVDKRPGFAAKREMLVGARAGEEARAAPERRAVVVGAGLAGTLASERLAARGWAVQLLDARPMRTAPGVGLVRPIANIRDAVNARLSRAAFLYAVQHYRGLHEEGHAVGWNPCGVLQVAADDDEARRFEAIAHSQGYPPQFLAYVDAARASAIAERATRRGGWWFELGAVLSPEALGLASLARAAARVTRTLGRPVQRLEREGRTWRALDAEGRVIAEAATLVLANAADARRLLPEARFALSSVRGQVTYLPAGIRPALKVVVSGTGYVAPLPDGGFCVGASYGHDDPDTSVRLADHQGNLERAEAMLPGFTPGIEATSLSGWTGYRATVPDRLPIYGPTAVEGVHAATGLGSRGLLWAPLGAELLACQLEGEPSPLPANLAGAVSPRRFLS